MIMAVIGTNTGEGFAIFELADCAEREVRQRQQVYPRLVGSSRMTQAFADRQTALMQAIARKLRAEADAEGASGDLFAETPEVCHV
ncbi:hypothetical protein PQI07_04320 [Methylobacterium sp. 092160098-2]|uniref:hypothetical protein n=1 Tax=Methylobacterium sp. 092160098-2 TaxID=3025129 RepID=UPI002381B58F|nr:hypothetical protein [Methylobacterium sp. 092160098-2]MDE4909926.1 hypothetical protein [Methylobacterium sp. 092160098-2]